MNIGESSAVFDLLDALRPGVFVDDLVEERAAEALVLLTSRAHTTLGAGTRLTLEQARERVALIHSQSGGSR